MKRIITTSCAALLVGAVTGIFTGGLTLVGVEVGFFGANSMIEVTSAGLSPGDRVVVP